MPLSLPRGATCRLLGSLALKPIKQPPQEAVLTAEEKGGEVVGVAIMLEGTWVRNGWPLARKFEDCKVMEKGVSASELLLLASTRLNMSSAEVLVILGAMMTKNSS